MLLSRMSSLLFGQGLLIVVFDSKMYVPHHDILWLVMKAIKLVGQFDWGVLLI